MDYLQSRGIRPEILAHCLKSGILYESKQHHNCVFVGKDAAGIPRFACKRGTIGSFKQDVPGSAKKYSFYLSPSVPSKSLSVCESPIDALSLATLRHMDHMSWDNRYYLSLGGASPAALLQFLQDHPNVTHVTLCLDNDEAGRAATGRLRELLANDDTLKKRGLSVTVKLPDASQGKDYNELLQRRLSSLQKEQRLELCSGR